MLELISIGEGVDELYSEGFSGFDILVLAAGDNQEVEAARRLGVLHHMVSPAFVAARSSPVHVPLHLADVF